MSRQWDSNYQRVVTEGAEADKKERRAYEFAAVPNVIYRGVTHENDLLQAQAADNEANRPALQEVAEKVIKHLRANGYPEACPVSFFQSHADCGWILEVSVDPNNEGDFEAVWGPVVVESGLGKRFCVHETVLPREPAAV